MERTKAAKRPAASGDESKLNAQQLKEMGNTLFASRKFNDAVACYSKAIVRFCMIACLWYLFSCLHSTGTAVYFFFNCIRKLVNQN